MPIRLTCGQCGRGMRAPDVALGKRVSCPHCGQVLEVPQDALVEPAAAPPPRPSPPAAPASGAATPLAGYRPKTAAVQPLESPPAAQSGAPRLPVTMLANKLIAGRTCPACAKPLNLGEPVQNCQDCQASHHQACWQARAGCAAAGCPSAPRAPEPAAPRAAAVGGAPTKVCSSCGEAIPYVARKCPYCQDWVDVKAQARAAESTDLEVGEWLLAILCSSIGCIFGIVWMAQEKPKGKKMFLVSLGASILWWLLSLAIGGLNSR